MTGKELRWCVARWLNFILQDTQQTDREMVATTLGITTEQLLNIGYDIILEGKTNYMNEEGHNADA